MCLLQTSAAPADNWPIGRTALDKTLPPCPKTLCIVDDIGLQPYKFVYIFAVFNINAVATRKYFHNYFESFY